MKTTVLTFACPKCHSAEHVGRSRRRNELEKLGTLIMLLPYRCRRCNFRFLAWMGAKNQNLAIFQFAARVVLMVASFWIPMHFLGAAVGAAIAGVIWLVLLAAVSEVV